YMSDDPSILIETAMSSLATQIEALNDRDYDMFTMVFTEKTKEQVSYDLFEKALAQHEKIPLSLEMIDKESSIVVSPGDIKLKMTNGRTLCNLVKVEFDWLIDDIFWKI
ncbi:MAG: hypothetical protein GY870_06965, partial [archaeon]|nr:hypothetical protein [archaeon]